MEKIHFFAVILLMTGIIYCRDWRIQRLNQFQQKYNNSEADIIFLLDVSGSVNDAGFNTEKEFIKSLLSHISVQPIASRVAVVTFGKQVQEDIDYIDYPYLDRDKCTFTKEFAKIYHRKGPATNMNGALNQAKSILDGANSRNLKRKHVNTVVFLLTDGYWNYGGDPTRIAQTLRDRSNYDVEIFSVGVGYVSQSQLQSISGSKDNVIIARDFSEFASLATRIRGDQIEKLYKTVDSSLCGVQCDPRARCSCGTISGIYTCACPPGTYGSGLPGRCHDCPVGTYKTYSSPDPCKLCPEKSVTKNVGSKSIKDCECLPGYTGAPFAGMPCKPLECNILPTSILNGKVTSCGKYYEETCSFTCNRYHHIANEVATSRKLTCTMKNGGTWDKPLPQCVATKCQWPPNPPHMKIHCNGNGVGDKCTYSCNTGYVLDGANERECSEDGQWSHSLPFCQVVTCPPVRKIDNVNINPVKCLTDPTNFNDACAYSCKPGFKFVSGDQKRICNSDGTWSGVELTCKDLTPPSITCPEHMVAETESGQAYKEITYIQPTVRDNSITGRDDITILQEPAAIKSPYEFPIGITLINFTAIDSSGNSDSCTFRVEILDRELPKFTYCPTDIPAKTDQVSDVVKTVQWDIPTFSDNSGQATLIYSSHNNPSTFSVGPANRIQYTIEDPSRNRVTCEFFIKVESKTCPTQEPPINGGLGCQFVYGWGHYCTISCQNPYDFNGPKAAGYVCTVMGKWATVPPTLPTKWPDCTAMQPQEGMGQQLKFFYYSGSCHDSIASRKQIADNFVQILDRVLSNEGGCSNAANARVCKGDNVQIKCGKIQSSSGRRRRRSVQNSLTIEVNLEVLSKEDRKTQEAVVNTLSSTVSNIKQQSGSDANQLKVIHVNGDTMVLEKIEKVGSITGVCIKGMVFDRVDKVVGNSVKTEQTCVSCIAGSYFDTISKQCKKCPKGTYTEHPGLLGCSPCPQGKTTVGEETTNSTNCKAPCPPGMFSSNGLQNCQACKKGFYQSSPYSKICIKCPGSTTTLGESSTSLSQCGMVCPHGTFSKTGVEPCEPCQIGFYQSSTGSKQCFQCPGKLSTHAVGSTEVSQCRAIDNCASKPCMNGGICTSEFNAFTCVCKSGYYGDRCQDEKSECLDKPCYGDAECVDQVNGFVCVCPSYYYGKFCSERQSRCDSSTCLNGGTCLDTSNEISCSCLPGWQGTFCERTIDKCSSSPCMNGGICLGLHRSFTCKCKTGFTGPLCNENVDDCEQNNLCLNGGTCVDGVNRFDCSCAAGYDGDRCQVNVNECASNPCRNAALCVDKVNGFECKCAPTFTGNICDKRLTNSNFDLIFTRGEQGYAEATFHQDLNQVSIAFWVKASSNDIESGTVLSYAVGDDSNTVDNALVLRDIHHMLFVVMGNEVETNITAADDQWHHVAVTWSGSTGVYKAYIDGMLITQASTLKKGVYIPSGGVFILGQEQDEVGRNFSASEALDGSISQLNVWNHVLSDSEILTMSSFRCDKVAGNVIAWSDFYDKVSEQVEIKVGLCKAQNTKFSAWLSSTSAAPKNAVDAQCMTNDLKNIKELNLIDAKCTINGFTCQDSTQKKYDPNNPTTCPSSVKIRYEQAFNGGSNCNSKTCNGNGRCEETLSDFVCLCNDGYTGKNCENEVQCEAIQSFPNGHVSSTGNKIYKFSCSSGYELLGSSTLYCSAGRLNNQVPKCVDINECSTSNGNCPHLCVNTPGSYFCECNKGFVKSASLCLDEDECKHNNCQDGCSNTYGSFKCRCRAGFRLAADERSCEDIDECKANTHNCQQLCVNTHSSYTCLCQPGFSLASDKTTCIPDPCPSILAPSNGQVSQGYGNYKTKITYSCNRNYRLNGPAIRICGADGKWSGSEPICEEITCPALASPYNGQALRSGRGEDSVYTFSCLSDFMMIGDAKRNCQQDGTWSGIQPRCIPYHCSPIVPPVNGIVIGSSFVLGATVIIKCNHGYMLAQKDNNYRTCQQDKLWSGTTNQCIRVNCPKPDNIANGTVKSTSYNYNDEIQYSCNQGYGLSGPPIRTCQINGEWSGIQPTCLWNSCGYPGSLINGEIVGKDFSFGRTVGYKCNIGFQLVGDIERKCLLSGRWTGASPICREINCADPGIPTNGERKGDVFTVNSTVLYDCLPGFSITGLRSMTCGINGQWNGAAPTCTAGICGASKVVGPTGSITSPNHPNSYTNNAYCRWNIVLPTNKLARLSISSLKTADLDDRVELFDGQDGSLLAVLTGSLFNPLLITSSSNKMDVRFVSNKENVADGFSAFYDGASCGGQITSFGAVIQTPNYPSNYPDGITCTWQIYLPKEKFKVKFERFHTANNFDKLEVWRSLTILNSATEVGSYHGNQGTFLTIDGFQVLYLKFSSDSVGRSAQGFKATIIKNTDIVL